MIFKPDNVDIQPIVNLIDWRIVRFTCNNISTIHAIGYDVDGEFGRVSSNIVSINIEDLTLKTKSGRTYKLNKDHRYNGLALDVNYTWNKWLEINSQGKQYTLEFFPDLKDMEKYYAP